MKFKLTGKEMLALYNLLHQIKVETNFSDDTNEALAATGDAAELESVYNRLKSVILQSVDLDVRRRFDLWMADQKKKVADLKKDEEQPHVGIQDHDWNSNVSAISDCTLDIRNDSSQDQERSNE